MNTFQWSKELTERLISLYQAREFLYNHNLPEYGYRKKREAARTEIFNELKKIDDNISMEDVYLKCKSLRENYLRERKRFLNFKRCEKARDEDYVPILWYYHKLHFFEPYLRMDSGDDSPEGKKTKPKALKTRGKFPKVNKPQPKVRTRIIQRPRDRLHQQVTYVDNTEPRLHNQLTEVSSKNDQSKFANSKRVLQEQASEISNILAKKTDKKYDWLGKQVVFEINKVTSETLQEDAVWAIQSILRSTLRKDRLQQQNGNQSLSKVTSSTPIAVRSIKSLQDDSIVAYRTIDMLAESALDLLDEEDC